MPLVYRLIVIITFSSFIIPSVAADQPYFYSLKKELITVLGEDQGYSTSVFCRGTFQNDKTSQIYLPYSELEQIGDISASYLNEKGKFVKLKNRDIGNTMIPTGNFYSGYRAYFFNLDPQGKAYPFEYSYVQKSNMLMLLNLLPLISNEKVDTLIYEIRVPFGYKLLYKISGDTSEIKEYRLDEKKEMGFQVFTFTVRPGDPPKHQPIFSRFVFSNFDFPRIELIVLPENKTDGFAYLNDWYTNLISSKSILNGETLKVIDSLTASAVDDEEKVKLVFDYVREKVAYLDVENGLGAFQPRDPNDVLLKKQGDCKDMANLLYCSLKHLGIESNIALSASLSHFTDLEFPTIASADHVICLAKLGDNWIYLDATDPEIEYGLPSRHIQDRNIFIINDSGGKIHKVKHVPSTENKVIHRYVLKKVDNGLSGSFTANYSGLSRIEILTYTNRQSPQKYISALITELNSASKNIQYQNLEVLRDNDSLWIKANIISEKNFLDVSGKKYFSLNFLPRAHNLPQKIDSTQKIISFKSIHNEFEIFIVLEQNVKLKNPINTTFNKEGMRFTFNVEQHSSNQLRITYMCEIDHIVINKDLLPIYSEMNAIINNIFTQSIIYE